MGFKNFLVVLAKELKDVLRDRKSLIAAIVVPVILYPLMMLFISGGMDDLFDSDEAVRAAVVDLDGGAADEADVEKIRGILSDDRNCTVIAFDSIEEAARALTRGELSVVVRVEKGFANVEDGGKYRVGYVVDNRSVSALAGAERVQSLIAAFADRVYSDRLGGKLDPSDIEELECLDDQGMASADDFVDRPGTDNSLLLILVPILVALLISVGGSSIAVDLIAGEKERGTFEPLLSTAAGRFSILSAKYAVVLIYSFFAAAAQVVSLGLGIAISPSAAGAAGGLSLTFGGAVMAFFNILLLAALFCSVMLVLSATAKSTKEAGVKTSFLIFIPLILAYCTMFTDAVDVGWLNMICPVANVCFVVKMVLSGYLVYPFFWISLAANAVYVAAALGLTFYVFGRENLVGRS